MKVSRTIVAAKLNRQTMRNARLRNSGKTSVAKFRGRDSAPENRLRGFATASGWPSSVRDSRSNSRLARNMRPATLAPNTNSPRHPTPCSSSSPMLSRAAASPRR